MSYKFEDRFVHFRWSDELVGKKCSLADTIGELEEAVRGGDLKTVLSNRVGDFPFETEYDLSMFCYYDPNYEAKIAYEEGKQIQISGDGEIWADWEDDHDPDWDSVWKFRIKPEEPKSRLMTYRELAEWIAKGNGQYSVKDNKYTSFYYDIEDEKEVPSIYKIRRWDSNEWIKPTIDVYMEDCKK